MRSFRETASMIVLCGLGALATSGCVGGTGDAGKDGLVSEAQAADQSTAGQCIPSTGAPTQMEPSWAAPPAPSCTVTAGADTVPAPPPPSGQAPVPVPSTDQSPAPAPTPGQAPAPTSGTPADTSQQGCNCGGATGTPSQDTGPAQATPPSQDTGPAQGTYRCRARRLGGQRAPL